VLFGTNPIVVRSWFGVLSSAEVLWIVAFIAIVIWMLANYMIHDFDEANRTISISKPNETLWGKKLKKTGFRLGFIGLVCLNLLFLPVSRGSVILRVLDIPFEHAIKYHVWLGNFVMTIFTLHGLSYCIAWFSEGCLIKVRAC
jgi:ferric-chelate reductase